MVMKYLFMSVLVLLGMLVPLRALARLVVVDSEDSLPVAGVAVIGGNGIIIGTTDADGSIAVGDEGCYPLVIRAMGYKSATLDAPVDTLALEPAAYSLRELVVSPGERPISRVVCFAREYCTGATGSDTLQLYCEYMTESFIADGKVKGYKSYYTRPRPRAARRYARFAGEGTDSVARPRYDDDVVGVLSWMEYLASVPGESIDERDAIRGGASTDTVAGKYSPKSVYKKTRASYIRTDDMLSDHKNHKYSPGFFKLLGFTIDTDKMTSSTVYKVNDRGRYGLHDYVYSTYSVHMLARGKHFKRWLHTKDPIDLDCYIELYPVAITRHTVEEFKAMKEEMTRIEFAEPENLLPMIPAVKSLVEQVEAGSR